MVVDPFDPEDDDGSLPLGGDIEDLPFASQPIFSIVTLDDPVFFEDGTTGSLEDPAEPPPATAATDMAWTSPFFSALESMGLTSEPSEAQSAATEASVKADGLAGSALEAIRSFLGGREASLDSAQFVSSGSFDFQDFQGDTTDASFDPFDGLEFVWRSDVMPTLSADVPSFDFGDPGSPPPADPFDPLLGG